MRCIVSMLLSAIGCIISAKTGQNHFNLMVTKAITISLFSPDSIPHGLKSPSSNHFTSNAIVGVRKIRSFGSTKMAV